MNLLKQILITHKMITLVSAGIFVVSAIGVAAFVALDSAKPKPTGNTTAKSDTSQTGSAETTQGAPQSDDDTKSDTQSPSPSKPSTGQVSTNKKSSGSSGSTTSSTTGSGSSASSGSTSPGSNSGNGSSGGGGSSGGSSSNSPPTAPTNAHVGYLSSSSVRIDCNKATDSDGIAKHELLRNGVVVASSTSQTAVIGISDGGIAVGQTYTYTVRAVDTLGSTGPVSNSVVVTIPVPDTTAPSAPTNFRITSNSGGSLTLAWDASTDDQTPQGDIWYILTSPLDESDFYTWTRINPYTTGWFDPGTTHDIYIQSLDLAGNASAKVGPLTFTQQ